MKGIQHIEVSNRLAKFKFDLVRNITIVRGESGTGKSTLYNMISDFTRLGESSGVNISCNKKCVALLDSNWKNQLKGIKNSIVFIDEGSGFISSREFASTIKKTDNYYVIFNRESLYELPYSVEEIYQIKTSGKYHSFEKIYKADNKHFYSTKNSKKSFDYDTVLLEDTKSGLQFFKAYYKNSKIICESAGSNSSIYKCLKENLDKKILVIADGAAFGSDMDRIMKLQSERPQNIQICLPESFEWLLLKSGIIHKKIIESVLENPSEHIESKEYFNWEQFFYDFLREQTSDSPYMKYSKSKLPAYYLQQENAEKVMSEIFKY